MNANPNISPGLNDYRRSYAEVVAERDGPFIERDIYLVLIEPKRGEHYVLETPWPEMILRAAALQTAMDCDDKCRVFLCPANGQRQDISEDIAREALKAYRRECRVFQWDYSDLPNFISQHLEASEIAELSYLGNVPDHALETVSEEI